MIIPNKKKQQSFLENKNALKGRGGVNNELDSYVVAEKLGLKIDIFFW